MSEAPADASEDSDLPDLDEIFKQPSVNISKPLFAVMCIQENGNDKDAQARRKDYENVLFTMNQLLKLDCVYQLKKEKEANDKESDEKNDNGSASSIVFAPAGTLRDKASISKLIASDLKTSWTTDEMKSFCEKIRGIIDGKNNTYDGLICVMTAPAKRDNQLQERTGISDSDGKYIKLKSLFEIFDKDHSNLDAETFPTVFFIDRYYEFDPKLDIPEEYEKEEKDAENAQDALGAQGAQDAQDALDKLLDQQYDYNTDKPSDWGKVRMDIDMDDKARILQFYGHRKPLALMNIDETGGVVTRALEKILQNHPKKWPRFVTLGTFFHLFFSCDACLKNVIFPRYGAYSHYLAVDPFHTFDSHEFFLRLPAWGMN